MASPEITRSTIQAGAFTHSGWRIDTAEATEAKAANTRIWPTAPRKCSASFAPSRNPTK